MIRNVLERIADIITSDKFPGIMAIAFVFFGFGMIFGLDFADGLNMQKCNEMDISDAVKYPYCRNYFEQELKKADDYDE